MNIRKYVYFFFLNEKDIYMEFCIDFSLELYMIYLRIDSNNWEILVLSSDIFYNICFLLV